MKTTYFQWIYIIYLNFKLLFCVRKIQEVYIYGFGVKTEDPVCGTISAACYAHVFAYIITPFHSL